MRRPIPHLPVAVGVPEVVAPGLFVFECVSALRRMVVRKDLEEERTRSAMGLLGTMPVSLRAPQGLVERAWAIATELDRPTAYDSFYLGVAELLGIAARSTSPPWITWSPPDDPALDPAGGAR